MKEGKRRKEDEREKVERKKRNLREEGRKD